MFLYMVSSLFLLIPSVEKLIAITIIREIYLLYLDGIGPSKIADILNNRNISQELDKDSKKKDDKKNELKDDRFKFVSTNSNSFAVGFICIIADSCPTFNNPSPFPQVTKNPASPSLNLNTSFKYCISDLSCAKNNFVSEDVSTACASSFS